MDHISHFIFKKNKTTSIIYSTCGQASNTLLYICIKLTVMHKQIYVFIDVFVNNNNS